MWNINIHKLAIFSHTYFRCVWCVVGSLTTIVLIVTIVTTIVLMSFIWRKFEYVQQVRHVRCCMFMLSEFRNVFSRFRNADSDMSRRSSAGIRCSIQQDRWRQNWYAYNGIIVGVGDGGRGGTCPPKILEKIFFGQLLCKILAFFGQKSCKIREFCKFFGQIS